MPGISFADSVAQVGPITSACVALPGIRIIGVNRPSSLRQWLKRRTEECRAISKCGEIQIELSLTFVDSGSEVRRSTENKLSREDKSMPWTPWRSRCPYIIDRIRGTFHLTSKGQDDDQPARWTIDSLTSRSVLRAESKIQFSRSWDHASAKPNAPGTGSWPISPATTAVGAVR